MAVYSKAGFLIAPANPSIVPYTGVGFDPKAVLLFACNATNVSPNQNGSGDAQMMIGAAVSGGPAQRAGAILADNVHPTDSQYLVSQTNAIVMLDQVPNTLLYAAMKSLDQDGFTLNWGMVPEQTGAMRNLRVMYWAIGGDDITHVDLRTHFTPTLPGEVEAVDVGFDPDLLFTFAMAQRADFGGSGTIVDGNVHTTFGMAARDGGQGYTATLHTDGINPNSTEKQRQRTDRVFGWCNSSGVDAEAELVRMDAKGWTLKWHTKPVTAMAYAVLAIKGCRAKVGSLLQPTANGNQGTTGVGFTPNGLLLSTGAKGASSSTVADANHAIGVASGTTARGSVGKSSQDNYSAGSMAESFFRDDFALQMSDLTAVATVRADLVTFDSDGFTLNWTGTTALQRQVIYATIGTPTDSGTQFREMVTWPDAQVIGLVRVVPGLTVPNDQWQKARAYSEVVLGDSPAGYWRLGDTSGAAVELVASRNGTYTGGVTLGVAGVLSDGDFAADFDGSSDYVTVPDDAVFDFTTAITLEAWVWADGFGHGGGNSFPRIISKSSAGVTGYQLYVASSDSTLRFDLQGVTPSTFTSTGTLATGSWHHIVVTYDGANVRIYINGTLDSTTAATGSITTNTLALEFARRSDNTRFWDGKLDEVAVYNSALQPHQIANHYALKTSPWHRFTSVYQTRLAQQIQEFPQRVLDLVLGDGAKGSWSLGETAGPVAVDDTLNHLDAMYVGGVTFDQPGPTNDGIRAVLLNGSTGYVLVGHDAAIDLTTRGGYECWFKPASNSGLQVLAHKGNSGNMTGWELANNAGTLQVVFRNVSTTTLSGGTLVVGQWHHALWTFDTSTVKLYLDGVLVASAARTNTISTTEHLYLGRRQSGSFFSGTLGRCSIYKKPLSQAEATEHAAAAQQVRRFPGGIRREPVGFEVDGVAYSLGGTDAMVENYPGTWRWADGWLYVQVRPAGTVFTTATNPSPGTKTAVQVLVAFYFATKGIALNATDGDSSTGTYWHPWILGDLPALQAKREDLLSGAKVSGGGPLTLANGHGFFNDLVAGYEWKNRQVDMLVGGNYNQGRVVLQRSEYVYWATMTVADIQANDQACVLELVGPGNKLHVPMPVTSYRTTEYPSLPADLSGVRKRIIYGRAIVRPDLTDPTTFTYTVADAAKQTLTAVRRVWVDRGSTVEELVPAQFVADLTACTLRITDPGITQDGSGKAVSGLVIQALVEGKPDLVDGGYLRTPGKIGKDLLQTFANIGEASFDNNNILEYDREAPDVSVVIEEPRLLSEVLTSDQRNRACLERTGIASWYQRPNGQWIIRPWDPTTDLTVPHLTKSLFTKFEPRPFLSTIVGGTRVHFGAIGDGEAWQVYEHEDQRTRGLADAYGWQDIYSYLVKRFDAQVLAERLQFIAGSPRLIVDFALRTPVLAEAVPGDRVLVTYDPAPVPGGRMDRMPFEVVEIEKRITQAGGLEISGVMVDLHGVQGRLRQIDAANTLPDWASADADQRLAYLFFSDDQDYVDKDDPDTRPGGKPLCIFW